MPDYRCHFLLYESSGGKSWEEQKMAQKKRAAENSFRLVTGEVNGRGYRFLFFSSYLFLFGFDNRDSTLIMR
jgi:hypothetical protein